MSRKLLHFSLHYVTSGDVPLARPLRVPAGDTRHLMRSLFRSILDRAPYIGRLRQQVRAAGVYGPGHFYSPIPDPSDVVDRVNRSKELRSGELADVALNMDRQRALVGAFERFYADLPFTEEPSAGLRYYFRQHFFCYADAIFLYSFLRHFQPRRIVEVGSGFSSAVMLDTIDRFFADPPNIVLVEPYPRNLRALLRDDDWQRLTLIEDKVQKVPLSRSTGYGLVICCSSTRATW